MRRDTMRDERQHVLMLSRDRRTWREIAIGAATPRWAPDSRRLAFLRRAEGKSALFVQDTDTGAEHVLIESDAALREICVSPDGTSIAFQMHVDDPPPAWLKLPRAPGDMSWAPPFLVTERLIYRHDTVGNLREGSFQIHIVPADGSAAPRQLTSGPWSSFFFFAPGLAWSADGTELLLTASQRPDWDRAPSELDIHAVRVADGAVRRLTERPGPEAALAVSPSGSMIAYTGVEERGLSAQLRHVFVMDMATGESHALLPELDRSIDSLAFSGDGQSLFLCYDDLGRRVLACATLDGTLTRLADDVGGPGIEMPYAGGGFSVARDGTIVYIRTAIDAPSDIGLITPDGSIETLTALNAGLAAEIGGFADAEMFWIDGREGMRVQCWLMRPSSPAPTTGHPMILEIHGGPFAQYGERFSMKHQMLAAAGYAVLFANPAGSTGYGEKFALALHNRYPGPDYDDLIDAVDAALARGGLDAENVFITGISGGGTLSLWAIGRTQRFRAAVAIKPVVAWESWMLTADIGPTTGRTWMGGKLPWEESEKFRLRSPITGLRHARTPTMLIAGDADARTPLSEAQQAYAALKLAGAEAALVRCPGVVHSSTSLRPSHFAAEVTCTLAWFERFRTR
jgi:acylaminoacyl-peptidase